MSNFIEAERFKVKIEEAPKGYKPPFSEYETHSTGQFTFEGNTYLFSAPKNLCSIYEATVKRTPLEDEQWFRRHGYTHPWLHIQLKYRHLNHLYQHEHWTEAMEIFDCMNYHNPVI